MVVVFFQFSFSGRTWSETSANRIGRNSFWALEGGTRRWDDEWNGGEQLNVLNESLICFFKIGPTWTNSSLTCQICNSMEHVATMCSTIGDLKPKCGNYGLLHRIENWGARCGYCLRMGHTKHKCWKKGKDVKTPMNNYYLEVMVNDEAATLK